MTDLPPWFGWLLAASMIGAPLGMIYLGASGYPVAAAAWAVGVFGAVYALYRWTIRGQD